MDLGKPMTKMNKNNFCSFPSFLSFMSLCNIIFKNKPIISIAILLFAAFTVPHVVESHGLNVLEFNPDESSRLKVSSNNLTQTFIPQNDAINGLDLWFDNTGNSGTASLKLYNQNGSLVSEKNNIAIPSLLEKRGGNRFHIDLSGQIVVSANQTYTLKIESNMPNLFIYYADRVQLLEHNAQTNSPYLI